MRRSPLNKKRDQPERLIQHAILQYLTLKGWFAFKINTTGIYKKASDSYIPNPNKGCPDIIAVKNKVAIAVEVKSNRGVQSDDQKAWQQRWEDRGCLYILARSIDDVQKLKL